MVTKGKIFCRKDKWLYIILFCGTEVVHQPLDSIDCEDVYEVEKLVESKARRISLLIAVAVCNFATVALGKIYYLAL